MFKYLGFTEAEAKHNLDFNGCVPICTTTRRFSIWSGSSIILGGQETIRDFIAFPKNNSKM
jgi:aspartyl-tRNA synthetase